MGDKVNKFVCVYYQKKLLVRLLYLSLIDSIFYQMVKKLAKSKNMKMSNVQIPRIK